MARRLTMNWRGEWSKLIPKTTQYSKYLKNDVVIYEGNAYIALEEVDGSVDPAQNTNNRIYRKWQVLSYSKVIDGGVF